MTRINLVLLLAVLASALYLVGVQYESRRLFTAIDRADSDALRHAAQFERLQVEKRAQATPLRVEKLAKEQLHMRAASPAITDYVSYPQPSSARRAAPAAGAAPGASQESRGLVQ